ncbi:hypothetical protein AAH978_19085 [Streptomyces sp. ZYX-F-203]
MDARLRSAMRSVWRDLGGGLMWMGFARNVMYPPLRWQYHWPWPSPTGRPCPRRRSEEELVAWSELAEQLR